MIFHSLPLPFPLPPTCRWRDCISDEHQVPSLLAMLGEDANTTCDYHGATYVDWSGGGPHPRDFVAADATPGGRAGGRQAGRRGRGATGKNAWEL